MVRLDDIQKNGVTERELQKAKNGLRVATLNRYKTNLGRAGLLAEYESNWGDWKRIYKVLADYDRVTAAQVQRAAKQILNPLNRTVVTLIPEKSDDAGKDAK